MFVASKRVQGPAIKRDDTYLPDNVKPLLLRDMTKYAFRQAVVGIFWP